MKKLRSILLVSAFLISGLIYPADTSNDAATLNTIMQGTMTAWQMANIAFGAQLNNFCLDCVSKIKNAQVSCNTTLYKLECSKNITGLLNTALSGAITASGNGSDTTTIVSSAFGVVSNVLPELLLYSEARCATLLCDSSKKANKAAAVSCKATCSSIISPVITSTCATADSTCALEPYNAAACAAAQTIATTCAAELPKCIAACVGCMTADDLVYDNTEYCAGMLSDPLCVPLIGQDYAQYYNAVVTEAKEAAIVKQPVCKTKCIAKSKMNWQRAVNYVLQAGSLATTIAALQGGSEGGGGETTDPHREVTTPPPSTSKNCADEPTAEKKKICYCMKVAGYEYVGGSCIPVKTAGGGSNGNDNTNFNYQSNGSNSADGSSSSSGGSSSESLPSGAASGGAVSGGGLVGASGAGDASKSKVSTGSGSNLSGKGSPTGSAGPGYAQQYAGGGSPSSSEAADGAAVNSKAKPSDIAKKTSKLFEEISVTLSDKYTKARTIGVK